jgi:mono/diheme cytochrome c family protein
VSGKIGAAMRLRHLLAFAAVTVLVAAGCGSSRPKTTLGEGAFAHARELFLAGKGGQPGCAFCHSLEAAGTVGPFGPDFDSVFGVDRDQFGATTKSLEKLVRKMIDHGVGACTAASFNPTACMPAKIVTGGDADAVATFVATCAARAKLPDCRAASRASLTGLPLKGYRLYLKYTCADCHTTTGNVAAAPTFKGLAGSKVKLTGGRTVVADDAYLIQSIRNPDAQIVAPFSPLVMSRRLPPGGVPPGDVKALVAFIKAVK